MKIVVFVLVLISLSPFATAEPVISEDSTMHASSPPRIGIGTELQIAVFANPTGNLIVPIEWKQFRLEPTVGVRFTRINDTNNASVTLTHVNAGIAAHYFASRTEHSKFYTGIGAVGTRSEVMAPEGTTLLDSGVIWAVSGGPVFGIEYLPLEDLSLGFEVGLLGSVNVSSGTPGFLSASTNSGFRIRYLF